MAEGTAATSSVSDVTAAAESSGGVNDGEGEKERRREIEEIREKRVSEKRLREREE